MREIKFRAWDTGKRLLFGVSDGFVHPERFCIRLNGEIYDINLPNKNDWKEELILMQYTGLKDKNGKEIYEGDIVGEEGVYHFLDREGWKPETGNWKIIGEKNKYFTGDREEKYIAGYRLEVVEWKDKSCGFEPFSDSEDNCGHCGGGKRSIDFEVIGNIYEHPGLLPLNG